MSYQYSPSAVSDNKKVDKASIGLQISHMLFVIVSIFASTFLISYIVSVNAENPLSTSIVSIAIYYISQFFVFGLSYFLMSFIVEKTSRIWIYRLGILLFGAFIVMVIFVGKELSKYIVLAGALYGLSEGVFHSAYNVLKGEMVPRRSMSNYSTLCLILDRVVRIVLPILMGFLIDSSTFFVVAIYVLVLVVIQLGVTFMIKSERPENSSFDFFAYLKSLKSKNQDMVRIKRVYNISWLYGFKTIFNTLFSIITIYTFKTNFKLGIFTSVSAFASIIGLILFKRCTKEGSRTPLYISLSLLLFFSIVGFTLFMNKWTYILYALVSAVSLNILANGIDIQRNLIVKKTGHYSDIAEHNCVVELIFTFSRILTYSFMLVLGLTLDLLGIKICLVVCASVMPILAIMVSRMEKVECKFSLENPTNAQTIARKDNQNKEEVHDDVVKSIESAENTDNFEG